MGKQDITVKLLLNHQAGLPALRAPVPAGGTFDWDLMTTMLAAEAPFWQPGTRHGYHFTNFGWLVGEVVRRVSGISLGTFFQQEVAQPLGLDFWIGLPERIDARVAPLIPAAPRSADEPTPPYLEALADRGSMQYLAMTNDGGQAQAARRVRFAAELPGGGGISNARSLAGMYAPLACGGSLKGVRLVDSNTLGRMAAVSSAGLDAFALVPVRYALGFHKSFDNRRLAPGRQDSIILAEEAFGHIGAGGSIGFADPLARMSFAYTMNRMGAEVYLNPRGQSLVDAAYRSLGYASNASGTWL